MVEGFGILSMASVCPILSVLLVGMSVTRKRNAALKEAEDEDKAAAGRSLPEESGGDLDLIAQVGHRLTVLAEQNSDLLDRIDVD